MASIRSLPLQRCAMAEKNVAGPADKVELYVRLLDSVPEIDSKSNFGSAYTAINRNMYTIFSKHGVLGYVCPSRSGASS